VNSDKFKARLFVVAAPLYHKNPHFKFAGYKGVKFAEQARRGIEV
jgi:hypothetical protein